MSEHILVERGDGRLRIRMNRPDRRNAITVAMYAALADAIEGAAADTRIRLITLEGTGEDFTAGNDLADFLAEMPPPGITDIPVWRLLRALARNEVPIVAAVHGNAVGIGTTMLFHCDLVRLAGRRRAARFLLLGESFGPEEALEFGLVSHVVPKDELERALEDMAATLLAKPAEALRLTQRLLRRGPTEELLERMELENGHFAERLTSDEVRQAITAFFAARAAKTAPAK
jgi:enoyl-CoA hydratase/carnithine racemase